MNKPKHKWEDVSSLALVSAKMPRPPEHAKSGAEQRIQFCGRCLWVRMQVDPPRGGDNVVWAYTDLYGRIQTWHEFRSGANPKCGEAKATMRQRWGADCMKRQIDMELEDES